MASIMFSLLLPIKFASTSHSSIMTIKFLCCGFLCVIFIPIGKSKWNIKKFSILYQWTEESRKENWVQVVVATVTMAMAHRWGINEFYILHKLLAGNPKRENTLIIKLQINERMWCWWRGRCYCWLKEDTNCILVDIWAFLLVLPHNAHCNSVDNLIGGEFSTLVWEEMGIAVFKFFFS